MARENNVRLRGIVLKNPMIVTRGDVQVATVILKVIRPDRAAGDNSGFAHSADVRIMSQDPEIVSEIATWHENDIADVKGFLSSKQVNKASFCPTCHTKNVRKGSLVFVIANYVEKLGSVEDKGELPYLLKKREISNTIHVFGNLLQNPKMLTTFAGLDFTQYQIAVNRKYRVKEDDPKIKTDYPWVKSYGDQARIDRFRLQKGAEVYVDGCLQNRTVNRKAFCGQLYDLEEGYMTTPDGLPVIQKDDNGKPMGCGTEYYWHDQVLEIVPFAVEYVSGYLTEEEAERRQKLRQLQHEKDGGTNPFFNRTLYDTFTPEDEEHGMDPLDQDAVEE